MNKKIGMTAVVFMLLAVSTSKAGADGFIGTPTTPTLTTVADAQSLSDNAPVLLQGKIIRALDKKGEEFLFADKTGEVVIEIERQVWRGLSVTADDTIEVFGYVDKEWGRIKEIEVTLIRKL